jgi:hypothetical protein
MLLVFALVVGNLVLGVPNQTNVAQAAPGLAYQTHHFALPVRLPYSCLYPNNCHAVALWNTLASEIDGMATNLTIPDLECNDYGSGKCSSNVSGQSRGGWHVNDTIFLVEYDSWSASNCGGACWTEIGDTTWWTGSYVVDRYYQADVRPCGGGFNVNYANLSGGDIGYNEQMVIQTRTGPGSHICGDTRNSTVYTYIQSHSSSSGNGGTVNTTYSPIIPNTYEYGIELVGADSESAGIADFTGSDYTPDNAQTWWRLPRIADYTTMDNPPFASWQVVPSWTNQGGDFRTWCC